MRPISLRFHAAALLSVLTLVAPPRSGVCQAQPGAGRKVILRHTYRLGSVRQYQWKITFKDKSEDGPVAVIATGILQEKVQSVQPDGAAAVMDSLGSVKVTYNGQPLELGGKPGEESVLQLLGTRAAQVRNRQGLITTTSLKGEATKEAPSPIGLSGNLIAQIFSPVYAVQPVGVGDVWSQEIGGVKPQGSEKLPVLQTTLLGKETMAGRSTLKLHMTTTMPNGGDNPAKYDATGYTDTKTGEYVRLEATLRGGDAKTGVIQLEMTLLPERKPGGKTQKPRTL